MKPSPKIIRPGQRKPYVKATRRQLAERRNFVARLLHAGKTKWQIHRSVREKFNVEWRQCDRYIFMARACAHVGRKAQLDPLW